MLDQMFETQVDESPRRATSLGLDKGKRAALKSQLDDNSLEARAKRLERTRARAKELHTIDRAKLSAASKVDLDVVLYGQEQSVRTSDKWKFGDTGGNFRPYVISQQSGSYQEIPDFLDSSHKVANTEDAEAYLSRLSAFSRVMDQVGHELRLSYLVDFGIGHARVLLDLLGQRDSFDFINAQREWGAFASPINARCDFAPEGNAIGVEIHDRAIAFSYRSWRF